MTTFPGVATLNDDKVPVMVGLDDDRITLVSGEVSIAEWLAGEYEVIDLGSGAFMIEAREDSIPFVPDDPTSFARGLHLEPVPAAGQGARGEKFAIVDGPPPRVMTVIGFWILVLVTTAVGVWAAINML